MDFAVDPEVPGLQDKGRERNLLASGIVETRSLVHVFPGGRICHAGIRPVRDVDRDEIFFSSATAEESQNAIGRAVPNPPGFALLQCRMGAAGRDELLMNGRKFDRRSEICPKTGSFSNKAGGPDSVVSLLPSRGRAWARRPQ